MPVLLAAVVVARGRRGRVRRHERQRRHATATLVVDRSFEIKTADPQRAFEPTASIVDRGIYDTFFTYKGGDLAHPVPLLVQSWTASKDAKTFTFNLRRNVHFADGTPLTSADVMWSLRRLQNLKGNPSFLLDGVTVSAGGQVHGRSALEDPEHGAPVDPGEHVARDRELEARQEARRHDAAGADKTDKAERWFNSPDSVGAGSGPYALKQYSTTSQIVLTPSPNYWGRDKAAFSSVVVRNMIAPTQLINVQRGKHEVAIDLSSEQALTIKGNKNLKVLTTPSTWVFWLFANNNPEISSSRRTSTSSRRVRYALDYKRSIVSVAGPGAIQAPGIIPSMFLGSLPQSGEDQAEPHEGEERARGVRGRKPDDHARVPERPDDQRRPVRDDGAEGAGEPAGGRFQGRPRWCACRHVAAEVPRRQDGVRPLAVGPGLSGSRRLPRLHAG